MSNDKYDAFFRDAEKSAEFNVSKQNIKARTMKSIHRNNKSSWRRAGIVIPVAAALAVFSMGAFAATYSEPVHNFFGSLLGPLTVQEINREVTDSHVIMTVRSAVNDGKSGMVVIEFTKEDMSTFSEDADVDSLTLTENRTGLEYQKQVRLSADRKHLYCILQVTSSSGLDKKKIELEIENLIGSKTGQTEKYDTDLSRYFSKEPIYGGEADYILEIQDFNQEISNGITFEGIAAVGNDLCVYYDVDALLENGVEIAFESAGTGECYEPANTVRYNSPRSEQKQRYCYIFPNMDVEDLGDMQVCITRIKNETLNGRWATSFSFSDSGESRIVKIKKKIELPEYSVDIQSVDINILGAQIKGTLLNKSNDIVTENFLLQVAFEDKQGKRIDLGTGSLEFSDGTFIMNCHSPEAVIADDIAKVILEGEEFDLK